MRKKKTKTNRTRENKNSTQVKLSIPEPMMKKLEQEKEKFSYKSVQEVVKDVLRDKFFRIQERKMTIRGRPKKIDPQAIISRKKIFSKEGVAVPL
ncbi:MAG: hypothetical protein AABW56_00090 [Nanoarchaeota archaeon]